jgi:hypothetical protein
VSPVHSSMRSLLYRTPRFTDKPSTWPAEEGRADPKDLELGFETECGCNWLRKLQ